MSLIVSKPTTSSRRGLVSIDRAGLWRGSPHKPLTESLRKSGGRNAAGRITSSSRGGGHIRRYRLIDFKRVKDGTIGVVERLERDPNRSAFIALVNYADDSKAYILAPQEIKPGDKIISGDRVDVKPGNAMPLLNIPAGVSVHNIELKIGKGGQLCRSAGSFAKIAGRGDDGYVLVQLMSGEVRRIHGACRATVGVVSNSDNKNIKLAKAGRSRWLGRRPHVRGVAMNPVDHPHGGGEGKTSGGRHPVTPWGKKTKGKKTSSGRNAKFVVSRRKK